MEATSITTEQFEQQLQKQQLNAMKWRELTEGQIYEIVGAEFITTQYGEACVLTLGDGEKVWAPSALCTRLKNENNKPFPRYVRPTGFKQSKKNWNQRYHSFDLV